MTDPAFSPAGKAAFSRLYPETPGLLTHNLVDHPLLTLESLVGLSQRLDPANVEYCRADLPIGVDPESVEANGLSIPDTIRSIEENGSWLVLKWIENDPVYKALLQETLAELEPLIRPVTGDMQSLQGFIFVSSPGAVTPFHMDPEHNILLQIRGSKTMTVFPAEDEEMTSNETHERYHIGGHRNLVWKDDYAMRSQAFPLAPGEAVHMPVKVPHWVKVGPDLSISLSITWRSSWSFRESDAHCFNAVLREYGMYPARPKRFPGDNHAKAFAARAVRRIRKLTGGAEI